MRAEHAENRGFCESTYLHNRGFGGGQDAIDLVGDGDTVAARIRDWLGDPRVACVANECAVTCKCGDELRRLMKKK